MSVERPTRPRNRTTPVSATASASGAAARKRSSGAGADRHTSSPETWFFRYPESFEHLRRVAQAWAAMHGHMPPFRVASLGCSCGAEPYSIAAALEGLVDASIVAVDRSPEDLAMARSGRLRPMTRRGAPPLWARAPWSLDDGAVVPRPELGRAITWIESDLFARELLAGVERFDAIFCRNVIIYLDEPDRMALGRLVARLLKPGGWLYLGHAEPSATIGLAWSRHAGSAFAVRAPADDHTDAAPVASTKAATESPTIAPRKPRVGVTGSAMGRTTSKAPRASTRTIGAGTPSPESIDSIRAMADAGLRDQALASARARHAGGDRDAALLELLGTLELAAGRFDEAEQHLRAAVYLDPSREEAAIQLKLMRSRRPTDEDRREDSSPQQRGEAVRRRTARSKDQRREPGIG